MEDKKNPTPGPEDTALKIKGLVYLKMKTLSSSIQPYVVPDACDFLLSVNHKRIHFESLTHSDRVCELDQLIH